MSNISANVKLNIETYLAGKNQPTHPSVIAFEKPWNGFKYWMAYSPYPNSNGEEENPCVAVSNDLLYWDIPNGFLNPIAFNEEVGCDELKDPHILYREDLDRIEVWYLGRLHPNVGGDGKSLTIFRKYSSNGVDWSDYEVLLKTDYLSPTVVWEDEKYKMWEIGFDGFPNTMGTVVYRESLDGKEWSDITHCLFNGRSSDIPIWHGAVTKIEGRYCFCYIECPAPCRNVCFAFSNDGISFEISNDRVELSYNWYSFYRPYIIFCDDYYYCYYGVIDYDNGWYISLSRGKKLCELKGLYEDDVQKMKELQDITNYKENAINCIIKESSRLYRLKLLLLIIPILIIQLIFHSVIGLLTSAAIVFMVCLYFVCRLYDSKRFGKIACLLMSFVQAAVIFLVSFAISDLILM